MCIRDSVSITDSVLSVFNGILNLGSGVRKIIDLVIAVIVSVVSSLELILEDGCIVFSSIDVGCELLND